MSHVATLLNLTKLANLPRTGWLLAGVQGPESIAAHSHGVAVLVVALGPLTKDLDTERACALAVAHDLAETWLTDLPKRTKELFEPGALEAAEDLAEKRALGGLDLAHELVGEYRSRATREARFVKACDQLHMGLVALGLVEAGHRGLDEFFASVERADLAEFPELAEFRTELLARWRSIS